MKIKLSELKRVIAEEAQMMEIDREALKGEPIDPDEPFEDYTERTMGTVDWLGDKIGDLLGVPHDKQNPVVAAYRDPGKGPATEVRVDRDALMDLVALAEEGAAWRRAKRMKGPSAARSRTSGQSPAPQPKKAAPAPASPAAIDFGDL